MASFGPYKVWNADTWECPGCGVQIVGGFADQPSRQDHWKDDFEEWLNKEKEFASSIVYDFERPQSEDA